jgi:hypothetical protein
MWALDNQTSYAAERNWIRDKRGMHQWIVAVRATFDVGRDGALRLADEQPPPVLAPEYRGEPAISSLLFDSDLLGVKPSTDILLEAHAHAPKGRPATSVPVSLRVGPLEKTVLVHGMRVYYRGAGGLSTTPPRPFSTQPIIYEWAYGGFDGSHPDPKKHRIDPRNPVGKGVASDPARLDHQPAHSLEYPSGGVTRVGPAGFGPIDRSWVPRLERAGTYDARWEATKKPLLPDDYDDTFASSAPDDQRFPKFLRGGETVTIVNMTPEGALRFELPRLHFGFTTHFGRQTQEHGSNLATVFMDTEKMRLSMTYQTVLPVPAKQVEQLDETEIAEKRLLR